MEKAINNILDPESLRVRAEDQLSSHKTEAGPPSDESDLKRLVHELQVHQIELQILNGELIATRNEIEEGLARYTELYDFAPVGYLTLDKNGIVTSVNLTGATILGMPRSVLLGSSLSCFVSSSCMSHFNAFCCTYMKMEDLNPVTSP